jgi:hypothetical protein
MAPTMGEIQEHAATVEYANGRIAVTADNSSLNEILRDVARRAGMGVEGSVIEERVFGKYGPAAPAEVLSALLTGTGSNMMVVAGASHAPLLILTPKHGGPTPPRPRAKEDEIAQLEAELHQVSDHDGETGSAQPVTSEPEPAAAADKAGAGDRAERFSDSKLQEASAKADQPLTDNGKAVSAPAPDPSEPRS